MLELTPRTHAFFFLIPEMQLQPKREKSEAIKSTPFLGQEGKVWFLAQNHNSSCLDMNYKKNNSSTIGSPE